MKAAEVGQLAFVSDSMAATATAEAYVYQISYLSF